MASQTLEQIRADLGRIQADLSALDDRYVPLTEQVKALKKELNAQAKSIRKYMGSADLTELVLCGIRYTLEEVTDTKCTIARMRATLPEDTVAQYVQANTVTELKFRKAPVPPADE
jgi:chromosome segregation ATPase